MLQGDKSNNKVSIMLPHHRNNSTTSATDSFSSREHPTVFLDSAAFLLPKQFLANIFSIMTTSTLDLMNLLYTSNLSVLATLPTIAPVLLLFSKVYIRMKEGLDPN